MGEQLNKVSFQLLNGNNEIFLQNFAYKFDGVITSPPYAFGRKYGSTDDNDYAYCLSNIKNVFEKIFEMSDNGCRIFLNVKDNYSKRNFLSYDCITLMKDIGWIYFGEHIISSPSISKGTAWGSWRRATAPRILCVHEHLLIFYKGDWKKNKKQTELIDSNLFLNRIKSIWISNRFFSAGINKKLHPAQYSPEFVTDILKMYFLPGETILDPWCGVGNTGIACLNNGYNFIGMDKYEEYILIAEEKLKQIHSRGIF